MTKLTESAIYSPTIFRLETTTPVAGGEVILDGNDDPVQGYANAQAQLLANRTKYLKGVTDTLGTAAVANLTTSAFDTTAGRVLKVGDFGLGSIDTPVIANIDAFSTPSGFYKFTNGAGTKPVGGGAYAYVLINNWNGVTLNQTWIPYSTPQMFVRTTTDNNTWGACRSPDFDPGANAITVDTGSLGYGIGSGGTVTQVTSKGTGVTVHKPSGRIITAADSLAAGATAGFALTNNKIAATDCLVVNCLLNNNYRVECAYVAAGVAGIRITNLTAGALAEIIYLNFSIIKGASA